MGLPVRQQWSLRRTEYSLRRSDPQLVAIMRTFGRFALDGRIPKHECLTAGIVARWQWLAGAIVSIVLTVAYAAWRIVRTIGGWGRWLLARCRGQRDRPMAAPSAEIAPGGAA